MEYASPHTGKHLAVICRAAGQGVLLGLVQLVLGDPVGAGVVTGEDLRRVSG
jgi:hypothetical protein